MKIQKIVQLLLLALLIHSGVTHSMFQRTAARRAGATMFSPGSYLGQARQTMANKWGQARNAASDKYSKMKKAAFDNMPTGPLERPSINTTGTGLGSYAAYQGLSGTTVMPEEIKEEQEKMSPSEEVVVATGSSNALIIADAVDENQIPATLRQKMAKMWESIRNIDVTKFPAQSAALFAQLITVLKAQLATIRAKIPKSAAEKAVDEQNAVIVETNIEKLEQGLDIAEAQLDQQAPVETEPAAETPVAVMPHSAADL